VTQEFIGKVSKAFNERHGDLFEVWEVNVEATEDDLNDRSTWLLRFGSMLSSQAGDDLALMGDLGITQDVGWQARTPCLAKCPPNPTVDQVVETMVQVATQYWIADSVHHE
jgi:hypothetical protein